MALLHLIIVIAIILMDGLLGLSLILNLYKNDLGFLKYGFYTDLVGKTIVYFVITWVYWQLSVSKQEAKRLEDIEVIDETKSVKSVKQKNRVSLNF